MKYTYFISFHYYGWSTGEEGFGNAKFESEFPINYERLCLMEKQLKKQHDVSHLVILNFQLL